MDKLNSPAEVSVAFLHIVCDIEKTVEEIEAREGFAKPSFVDGLVKQFERAVLNSLSDNHMIAEHARAIRDRNGKILFGDRYNEYHCHIWLSATQRYSEDVIAKVRTNGALAEGTALGQSLGLYELKLTPEVAGAWSANLISTIQSELESSSQNFDIVSEADAR